MSKGSNSNLRFQKKTRSRNPFLMKQVLYENCNKLKLCMNSTLKKYMSGLKDNLPKRLKYGFGRKENRPFLISV